VKTHSGIDSAKAAQAEGATAGRQSREVAAQAGSLLYRRLPVGEPFEATVRGLATRDTAGCQPALRFRRAFTLLELLVVIGIIALLAALTMPVLNNFKPDYAASATRQMLDALSRARQLALSQRTTVYMVFVPTNFWSDPAYSTAASVPTERAKLDKLLDKQGIGYNYVSLRSLGDQPGHPSVRYLSSWKTLPDGAFIPLQKFGDYNPAALLYTNNAAGNPVLGFQIATFPKTTKVPFPSEFTPRYRPAAPYIKLPYIAFDYMGRLVAYDDSSGQQLAPRDENIPLGKGNVVFSRDQQSKLALAAVPKIIEQPPGNALGTNSFNVVHIDWLTGRARAIQQEVR
jgi:prepilin-type N-terminal cleavage/methylation domain-containing protein